MNGQGQGLAQCPTWDLSQLDPAVLSQALAIGFTVGSAVFAAVFAARALLAAIRKL